jgi:hypothetical protein
MIFSTTKFSPPATLIWQQRKCLNWQSCFTSVSAIWYSKVFEKYAKFQLSQPTLIFHLSAITNEILELGTWNLEFRINYIIGLFKLLQSKAVGGVKLITQLHLVPRISVRNLPPLCHMSSGRAEEETFTCLVRQIFYALKITIKARMRTRDPVLEKLTFRNNGM